MPYLSNTPEDQQEMLRTIGAASVGELFDVIPEELRYQGDLDIPPAMSEMELCRHMSALAARNRSSREMVCFLGGGSYDHFIPAVVDAIAARSEFYTSYTPYQAEVSQGNLQVMFEYQTLIAQLTGMDVANASVYDGGSAAAEAALMAMRCSGRYGKVVMAASLHPEYRQIISTYLANVETEPVTVGTPDGRISPAELAAAVDDRTACVLVGQPNFFGCLEPVAEIAEIAHKAGALMVVACDLVSLGLLKRPGDYGADIVVAEGQPLGTPMSYGGPYLGVMACRRELVRRLPGRIAGQTVDRHGRRCYVLTLQTREQHIRREKATSNICTNQGLFALRAAVYLAQMGPRGMRSVAQLCLRKAHYAVEQIRAGGRFSLAFPPPNYKEFVLRDAANQVDQVLATAAKAGFLAGVPLGRWYPELADCFLVAVTEKRTREEIDTLASLLNNAPTMATQHA
jgi:glycine dehydrogenase subunit 1